MPLTGDLAHEVPTWYVSGAHFSAVGFPTTFIQGAVPGWNAVTVNNTFNNRLQITRQQAISPVPSTLMDLSYVYSQSSPTVINNNGSVLGVTNNKDNTRSVSFAYDQVNRLSSAQTTSSSLWGDAFVYDPWSNLLQKNVIKGTAENLAVAVNAHNQVSGYTYDVSGNLKWDAYNALNFNAENQVTPASGLSYTYDGDGRRVVKSTKNFYWVDDNFQALTVTDPSGNPQSDFIFFNGRRIGMVSIASGNPYYYLGDQLGSTGVIASGDGKAIMWESDYYPYGGTRLLTNNLTNYYQFTGYEKDFETGYNYSVYRYQSPTLGRFFSPDPIPGNVVDPQSWNRYAYVNNDPVNGTDPLGLKKIYLCLSYDEIAGYSCVGIDLPDLPIFDFPGRAGGGSGKKPPANNGIPVQRTFQKTFQCSSSASGVISALENNFASFANDPAQGNLSTFSIFTPGAASPGREIGINVGVQTVGHTIGYSDVSVTVQSATANQLVFESNPGHVLYPATVSFSASDAGNGSITFTTAVNATTNGLWGTAQFYLLGGRAGETSTWNNLLNNVANFCSQPNHP